MTVAARAAASTSIRVDAHVRDRLSELARADGLSLNAYLGALADKQWRSHVFAEFRAAEALAQADPAYRAELESWAEADDGQAWPDDGIWWAQA
jgi:predicted transcriptional regulator